MQRGGVKTDCSCHNNADASTTKTSWGVRFNRSGIYGHRKKNTIKLRYNNLLIIIWMSHEVVLKQSIASINNVELFNSTIFLG